MKQAGAILDIRGLKTLQQRSKAIAHAALLQAAEHVRDEAKADAPKDTTALAESIHIVSQVYSDYDVAMSSAEAAWMAAKAAGRTPKGQRIGPNQNFDGLPEIRPDNPTEVWVVIGMAYGWDVELGNARTAAQPFLVPALIRNTDRLAVYLKEEVNSEISAIGKAFEGMT